MCGIAGFVGASRAPALNGDADRRELLERMCTVIRHRGPDDAGLFVGDAAALGMRRLSIIDLSTGHQPIPNEARTVWIVFNGEIYNFRALRRELESAGHRFSTNTDTETIVHAYEEWGTDAIGRLRGMFGLAIWDTRSRSLLLARDRMGIKPLHYAEVGGRLYFGSEIKSILQSPEVSRAIDLDALEHYLAFLYTPSDGSIFQSVRKLPPGCLLLWRDGTYRIERYWQMPAVEDFTGSEEEARERLRGTLTDAVGSHLMSDVPLGAFLSGGVDSSLVVALMATVSNARVKTFSIGFDEPAVDELAHARRVAERFGTDHHEFVVRPDALTILDRLITHFDEPFADASAIPTWYVSELARQHVTVVLSGDGGDELFGGYDRYLPHPRVAAVDRYTPPALRRLGAAAGARLPHGARGRNFLRHVGLSPRARYLDSIRFFSAEERQALLDPEIAQRNRAIDPEQRMAARFERFAGLPWTAQMMRFDAETYLPDDVLTKVDRMSMAHSIESRVPLLDNDVVTLAASLPADFAIRGGRRKHLLKEVAAAFLPADLVDRKKQGFAVPLDNWFRGSLRELCADVLLAPRALQRGYFNGEFVRSLVAQHVSGARNHDLRLWQLIVFELWHRQHADASHAGPSTLTPEAAIA